MIVWSSRCASAFESFEVPAEYSLKAKAGHVAGGKVYGYRNVREGSNVARVIHEPEAQVIRRIFEMTAEGAGLLRIAKALNAEGVTSPRGDGWASTCVREVLRRPLYRGLLVYGKTKWVDKGGTKVKVKVPESEWLPALDRPELRIVPEVLWQAAHERMDRTRQTYSGRRSATGQLQGRAEAGLISHHLLSGFLRCGVCGGNLFVAARSGNGQRPAPQLSYCCTTHHKRGNTRCPNKHGVPYHGITEAIVGQFTRESLERALLEQPAPGPVDVDAERKGLEGELARLDKAIQNLVGAIEAGGDLPALVERLTTAQRQRDEVAAKLHALEDWQDPSEAIREWLRDDRADWAPWRIEEDPVEGRRILRHLLVGPITVTPVLDEAGLVEGWEFLGQVGLDRLLAGRLPQARSVTKANATELVPPA